MGEVGTATDTRLDGTVAITVLPEHVAGDRLEAGHGPSHRCKGCSTISLNIALADTMAMTLAEVGEEAAASVRKGLEPAPDHPSTRLNVGTHMLLAELQGLEFDSLVGGLAFDDLQDLIHRHVVERLREAARWPEDFKHLET